MGISAVRLAHPDSKSGGPQVRILPPRQRPFRRKSGWPFSILVMIYYTYILQSEKTTGLYIGSTNNLEDRIHRHNTNRNKYTKGKGPWEVIFNRGFQTRSEAMKLEYHLKRKKNKQKILAWVSAQSD